MEWGLDEDDNFIIIEASLQLSGAILIRSTFSTKLKVMFSKTMMTMMNKSNFKKWKKIKNKNLSYKQTM